MKRRIYLISIVLVLVFATACSNQQNTLQSKGKPVKVVEIKEESNEVALSYSGIVGSSELKKLAFKSSGRIKAINVEKGQKIKAGDILIELDEGDLKHSLEASEGQMKAAASTYDKAVNGATSEELRTAELNVKKAQDSYDFVLSNYKKVEALYNSGAASKLDLDKAKLEADIGESELKQATELLNQTKKGARAEDKEALLHQTEQAKADYEYKKSLLQDAVMTSDSEGYIVDILYKKGELVQAGYPAVVVRNAGLVVNVGLSGKDFSKVMLGTKAKVSVGGKTVGGTVTNISQVPDAQTRTYNIEITLEENSLNLGAVAKVDIVAGNESGIWIPLTSMLSDGTDYVYLARDNIAEKREIAIEGITGSKAKVTGLKPKEQLVVEGMKRLRAGDVISVLK
ncbi:MAG: efflux RND transporter periplasmic adaptor subunit [Caulobacteraceae bacterium]